MAPKWPFSLERGNYLGDPISLDDLKTFSNNFKVEVGLAKKEDSLASKFVVNGEVRQAEFFGIERILQLIKLAKQKKEKISGIRIYYGLAHEALDSNSGESKISTAPLSDSNITGLRPRLFLVAVDENGNDIEVDLTGFKDAPNGNGVGNGSPQPPYGES